MLVSVIGDDPIEFVQLIAHNSDGSPKEKTMGGKFWWKEVENRGNFRLQQNLVSNHYRILDEDHYRWFSSFEKDEALKRLDELHSQHRK